MYPYSALSGPKSIRLFELPAYSKEGARQGRLLHTTLDNCPDYEAVSYVWGSENDKATLQCDGHDLHITRNLAAALWRFRKPDVGRMLWIDSVCINQDDVVEKNHQIPLMADIYQKATCVLIWLGEEDYQGEETAKAIACAELLDELVRTRMSELQELEHVGKEVLGTPRNMDLIESRFKVPAVDSAEFSALDKFLHRPWFSRAWTFQESFVARERVAHCGRYWFPGFLLVTVWLGLTRLYHCTDDVRYYRTYDALFVPMLAAELSKLREKSKLRLGPEEVEEASPLSGIDHSLLFLLEQRRGSSCKDSRDLVYSLLGAAADNVKIDPDYARPFDYAFAESTVQIIRASGRLMALHLVWPEMEHTTLPSWCPDWRAPASSRKTRYSGFASLYRLHPYDATSSSKALVQMSSNAKEFTLQGIELDEVEVVGDSFGDDLVEWVRGNHPALTQDQAEYISTGEKLEHAIVRIQCTDRELFHPQDPWVRWGPESLQTLKDLGDVEDDSSDKTRLAGLVEKVTENLVGKNFVVTQEGRLGLVPEWAKPGDAIVFLMGGEVPYVLRLDPIDGEYTFVGECYVHGYMDGEALLDARYEVQPDREESDVSWLEHLDQGPWPFLTEGFTIK